MCVCGSIRVGMCLLPYAREYLYVCAGHNGWNHLMTRDVGVYVGMCACVHVCVCVCVEGGQESSGWISTDINNWRTCAWNYTQQIHHGGATITTRTRRGGGSSAHQPEGDGDARVHKAAGSNPSTSTTQLSDRELSRGEFCFYSVKIQSPVLQKIIISYYLYENKCYIFNKQTKRTQGNLFLELSTTSINRWTRWEKTMKRSWKPKKGFSQGQKWSLVLLCCFYVSKCNQNQWK